MSPKVLRRLIAHLPEHPPCTTKLERRLLTRRPWYTSQREHWLGWLAGYDGPGAYGRKVFKHDAAFAYNHCACPPMVLWLGEAVGVDTAMVRRAARVALQAEAPFTTRCGIIRQTIPWSKIEPLLRQSQ